MSAKPTSWPCPIAFDDSTAVHALCDALSDGDAAIYALRLWHHRRRCGEVVDVGDPAGALEKACRWRRKKGVLVDAFTACGFVVRLPDGPIVIRAWEEVAFVDWTRSGGDAPKAEPTPEQEAKKANRRETDRVRSAARRAADAKRTGADAGADATSPQGVRRTSAADGTQAVAGKVPKSQGNGLAHTRATSTGTLTGTGADEEQEPTPTLSGSEAPTATEGKAPKAKAAKAPRPKWRDPCPAPLGGPHDAVPAGESAPDRENCTRCAAWHDLTMDAIDATMTRVYGADPDHVWTPAECTQLAKAKAAGFDRERIPRALEGLHAADAFNRGQPLHVLLEPGRLATGLRSRGTGPLFAVEKPRAPNEDRKGPNFAPPLPPGLQRKANP